MEIPEIRRRVRAAIQQAKTNAQERRARSDRAVREYDVFLEQRAVPAVQSLASALRGEGLRFTVQTPAGAVRLAADGSADDYLEVALDDTTDPPSVVGRTSRGRGRRNVSAERTLNAAVPIASLGEDDVLEFLLSEIPPFVER
jgi:hypothetical protein